MYVWDQEEPILSLRFQDLVEGNTKYEALKGLLARLPPNRLAIHGQDLTFTRASAPSMDAVKKAFLRCHRIIWKSEKMSPQAAFVEFAKLLFVKLWEDRQSGTTLLY